MRGGLDQCRTFPRTDPMSEENLSLSLHIQMSVCFRNSFPSEADSAGLLLSRRCTLPFSLRTGSGQTRIVSSQTDLCDVRVQSGSSQGIGPPNFSMVSRTNCRWSRKEVTDTRRIRASSALHLLKQRGPDHEKMKAVQAEEGRGAEPHTDSVLPLTLRCLLIPPLLGSLSGDKDLRAMVASPGDGNGTSRELQGGQGEPEQKPKPQRECGVYFTGQDGFSAEQSRAVDLLLRHAVTVTSQNQTTVG